MKIRRCLPAIAALAGLCLPSMEADACTNVIVTRGASADGSAIVSYAADSHWLFGELYFRPAGDWARGSVVKIYDWDSAQYHGEIEQVPHTFKTVGNMNEHQLIIAETTFGGREELVDTNGIIDYGSLIYITLQRASSAREAIGIMADLTARYGYCSEGETFTISDGEETWIMEMVGKGPHDPAGDGSDKGAVWVALRVPDGYICAHANQSRISTFPLNDPDNCLYSKDMFDFARKKGLFDGKDEDFSFRDAFCPDSFGGLRGCEARVWSAFNILGDGKFTFMDSAGNVTVRDAGDYLDYAMGYNAANRMPLFIKPDRKISVKDVADVMRDHYEGTPMDMTCDIGAGGNALPYRWRPMGFEYEGRTYTNERAIATQQTGFWFVAQSRPDLPDVIGGLIWFGTDDAATSYVTPIYTNTESVPDCFREGNGDLLTYSATSSFWINNRIANACYKMYNQMAPYVREKIDAFENGQMQKVLRADARAMEMYRKALPKAEKAGRKASDSYDPMTDTGKHFKDVRRFLTEYSTATAQEIFSEWRKLEETLLVKFIDGNVKAQNEDGSFRHSKNSVHIPDGLTQPGYTEFWKEAVVHYHGDVVEEK